MTLFRIYCRVYYPRVRWLAHRAMRRAWSFVPAIAVWHEKHMIIDRWYHGFHFSISRRPITLDPSLRP